jgi:hypothetical protein
MSMNLLELKCTITILRKNLYLENTFTLIIIPNVVLPSFPFPVGFHLLFLVGSIAVMLPLLSLSSSQYDNKEVN